MSTGTPTTTRNRLRRLKKGKTQTSPLIKMSSKSISSEPANIKNIDTNSNHPKDDYIEQDDHTTSPTSDQPTYRNYDMYTSSPCYVPNSQAPMPDREVYWDLDTPQSRKYREQIRKQIESISTPESEKRVHERVPAATPKLELAVNLKRVTRSQEQIEQDLRGEEALTELMELCRAQEDGDKEDSVDVKDEIIFDIGQDNISMESDNISMESDMFNSEISFISPESKVNDKAVVINNQTLDVDILEKSISNLSKFDDGDLFNDVCGAFDGDDDSFLIHASQAVEQAIPVVPLNKAVSKLKVENKEDGFGSDNDSFDIFVSQMDDSSKVTDEKEQQHKLVKQKPFSKHVEQVVSDEQLDTGIEINTNTSPVLKRRGKAIIPGYPLIQEDNNHLQIMRKLPVNSQSATALAEINVKSVMKKYSSFDTGLSSKQVKEAEKKSFQRFKSSQDMNKEHINKGQIINKVLSRNTITINSKFFNETSDDTKEDMKTIIERKKREALAKRALSLSQKQNR